MDFFVQINPIAGAYELFDLETATGTLTVRQVTGVSLHCYSRADDRSTPLTQGAIVEMGSIYSQLMIRTDTGEPGFYDVVLDLTTAAGTKSWTATAFVGAVLIDCDADRDGVVERDGEGKANWIWGENGRGAMVLVDNDADLANSKNLDEREPIVIRPVGTLPAGCKLRLSTAAEGALNFSLLRNTGKGFVKVLGRLPNEPPQALVTDSDDINPAGETLLLAAHAFPGPFFDGTLLMNLELVYSQGKREHVLGTDRILIRVAPWVMTPNTQPARKIYTCRMRNGAGNNDLFIAGLKAAVESEGLELVVIESADHSGDRWIQDEIEIGYSETHRGALPVVFDSPRDRMLDGYPEARMLGPDFGHFAVGGGVADSLDSFGNLEVSPPVTVDGRVYPLGRVIVGGRRDGQLSRGTRQMMAEVRQFLYSQRVQFPFEVYTDWLAVGHVDEIVSFVSDEESHKGFKCILASPGKVKSILAELQKAGHGDTLLFPNKRRLDGDGNLAEGASISVDKLLANADFWDGNDTYQGIMDEVRTVLKRELGLEEADIADIPVAFQVKRGDDGSLLRTLAYFPDMVNHLVHKDLSIVPKPYGPVVNGKCAFELAFETALPGRRVTFIDDWYSYHEMSGEVHCGTNALREPFGVSHWWSVRPEGGYDIKTLQI